MNIVVCVKHAPYMMCDKAPRLRAHTYLSPRMIDQPSAMFGRGCPRDVYMQALVQISSCHYVKRNMESAHAGSL